MEPYVFYSNTDSLTGARVTVVGIVEDGFLKLAASRCSGKDNFVKKTGREIAIARLKSNELITSVFVGKGMISTFIGAADAVSDSVLSNGVNQRISLIDNSKLFSGERGNYFNFEPNTFSYYLTE